MADHIYAVHDFDPAWAAIVKSAGKTAWAVISEGIGDDPEDQSGRDYTEVLRYGVTPMVRLNFSHHGEGTIPLPDRYYDFAQRCANFVRNSTGCIHWIIGNEPNLTGERPAGVAITPAQYARCYTLCRSSIKVEAGMTHQVIVAAVAPYNIDSGDWLLYHQEVLYEIDDRGSGADGIALHAYMRSANPADIASEAKMDAPFQTRNSGFRTYRDTLAATPAVMAHLPAYITEFDELDGWLDADTGVVRAAYREIDEWNRTPGTQKISMLALYRWKKHDKWFIEGKNGVINDFKRTLEATNYFAPDERFPDAPATPAGAPDTTYLPFVAGGTMPIAETKIEWDERLTKRGIVLTPYKARAGETYLQIIKGEYWEEKEHTFADTLDHNGQPLPGIMMRWWWGGGGNGEHEDKPTRLPNGDRWMVDFPMFNAGRSYGLKVLGYPSDSVFGMGLGSVEQPDWKIHVSYKFTYRMVVADGTAATEEPSVPASKRVPALTHPVSAPNFRVITQPFGLSQIDYSRFVVDGVPLKGHNGIDFGTPVGTMIQAVDAGRVVEVADEGNQGYGKYIKIEHPWGESLYAHLSSQYVNVGERVVTGNPIGYSGNSGNSTGPHLHFGMRVAPFNRRDGWGGFTDPLPYLVGATQPVSKPAAHLSDAEKLAIIKAAAVEFGVDWRLLGSLIMAESSWNPQSVNRSSGAAGLGNIMPSTWAEWSVKTGARDIYDPVDNARTTANYLAWCIRTTGDVRKGLWAYNWGPQRVLEGKTPPAETIEYATKILFGRDYAKAIGA